MKNTLVYLGIVAVIVIIALAGIKVYDFLNGSSIGSVSIGNEYHYVFMNPASSATQQLTTAPGALGSVIITGAGAGNFVLYNATTSNVNLRALATSSLDILAQFPNNTAAGTYTFDVVANYGILGVFTGAIGTSSITYR